MRIFITGASGFIGSHVAKALLEEGHELVALVRNPKKFPALSNTPKLSLIQGELKDHHLIREGMKNCEACIHIALGWGDRPLEMLMNDTTHAIFLLQTALQFNLKHFITTSSTAALGDLRPNMTENASTRPIDYYGASKASMENFVLAAGNSGFMQCNVIRPGYTFGNPAFPQGPTQPDDRFRKIVGKAKTNETISLVKNDGTQFIWAPDLAQLYVNLLDSGYNREIFHGLGTEFISWESIAQQAIELTESKSEIKLQDKNWEEEPRFFNVKKMEERFGLQPNGTHHIRTHLEFLINDN